MIKVKFVHNKKKYIAFIDAVSKKEAKQKLLEYCPCDCVIKSMRNVYSLENKIIIK